MSQLEFDDIARYAFGLLTARANTPVGEWLSGGDEDYWLEGSKDLELAFPDEFDEYLQLSLLNFANYYLHLAAQKTGTSIEALLAQLRDDYLDTGEADG